MNITNPCAVIYIPSPSTVAYLMENFGELDYGFIADEKMAFVQDAKYALERLDIDVVETDENSFTFTQRSGEQTKLTADDLSGFWGIILFNAKENPIEMDLNDIEAMGAKAEAFMR